jgi:hypothetical protein
MFGGHVLSFCLEDVSIILKKLKRVLPLLWNSTKTKLKTWKQQRTFEKEILWFPAQIWENKKAKKRGSFLDLRLSTIFACL